MIPQKVARSCKEVSTGGKGKQEKEVGEVDFAWRLLRSLNLPYQSLSTLLLYNMSVYYS